MTAVLPFGTESFWGVVSRFRRDLIAAAVEERVDLIYTYVYAEGDQQRVADLVAPYEKAGGAVSFVQLRASREVLLERVVSEDRRRHGKVTDTETLERLLDQYDDFTAIPDRTGLTIDVDEMSPQDAADVIIRHIAKTAL